MRVILPPDRWTFNRQREPQSQEQAVVTTCSSAVEYSLGTINALLIHSKSRVHVTHFNDNFSTYLNTRDDHPVIIRETNSNFGFNFLGGTGFLVLIDRIPKAGQEGMTIGLSHFRDPGELTLPRLLILPSIGSQGKYPFSR
jgi:hypothetical protein